MGGSIPAHCENPILHTTLNNTTPTGLAYMIVRSGEERNCGKFSFCSHNKKPTIVFVGLLHFNLTVRKMASTAAPPDSAPRHPVVILEISTDSQHGVKDEDDEIPMFPNRYVGIDNKAIGGDFEMPAAKQNS